MHPHVLHLNGIDLCARAFGRRGDPALLLIGGASSAMDWWETAFCERLAQGGRFVIRYDLRDTGQSSHWPAGEAMAREIPGARLLAVPGMGHELPPRPTWDLVIPAMLRHTAA